MFNLQQGKFAFCSSGVSGQAAVGSYHSMAGDEDTDRIVSDGISYRLGSHVGPSEPTGGFSSNLFVRPCFSVGDAAQDVPDGLLERGTCQLNRREKVGLAFRKINVEPLSGLTEDRSFRFFSLSLKGAAEILLPVKPKSAELVARGRKCDASKRGIIMADEGHVKRFFERVDVDKRRFLKTCKKRLCVLSKT